MSDRDKAVKLAVSKSASGQTATAAEFNYPDFCDIKRQGEFSSRRVK